MRKLQPHSPRKKSKSSQQKLRSCQVPPSFFWRFGRRLNPTPSPAEKGGGRGAGAHYVKPTFLHKIAIFKSFDTVSILELDCKTLFMHLRLKYQTPFLSIMALCSARNLLMLNQKKFYLHFWILSIFCLKAAY